MSRYLVVANQTATSPQLTDRLATLARDDLRAEFMLLVPATHPSHLLTWTEGEASSAALRVAEAAREHMRSFGLRVCGVAVGDQSPAMAIADEMRSAQQPYSAVIISMLPRGVSRWFSMDVVSRVARQFPIRVITVVGDATPLPDLTGDKQQPVRLGHPTSRADHG